jgi:hypothetical protein
VAKNNNIIFCATPLETPLQFRKWRPRGNAAAKNVQRWRPQWNIEVLYTINFYFMDVTVSIYISDVIQIIRRENLESEKVVIVHNSF